MCNVRTRGRLGRLAMLGAALSLIGTVGGRAENAGQVSIDNFTFSPGVLTVSKGTEVTWTNRDDIPHSIVLGPISVRSAALDTDKTFSHRFDTAGTFSYMCGLHPHMQAKVVVN